MSSTPHPNIEGYLPSQKHLLQLVLKAIHQMKLPPSRVHDLDESTRLRLLVLILDMNTLGGLARIGCVSNGAMLPVRVVHKLTLELKSSIDVREAELDVGSLSQD